MDPKAIVKCYSRLRIASDALSGMQQAQEAGDFTRYCDQWVIFLTAWKGIYTVLEQGAKVSPQSRQWFGAKARERKGDHLLKFLYAARNDEEHGLNAPLQMANSVKFYKVPDDMKDGDTLRWVRDASGNPVGVERTDGGTLNVIAQTGPGPAFPPYVEARGGIKLGTPTEHLGSTIGDITPIGLATLGLAYMEALVAEAQGMCRP